jgi:hypothetical protein
MGNYGNTLDRWYKRTAIVLWPRKNNLESKFVIDVNMGIKELLKVIRINVNEGVNIYKTLIKTFSYKIKDAKAEYLIDLAIALDNQESLKEIIFNSGINKILYAKIKKITELVSHFGDKVVSCVFREARKGYWVQEDNSKAYIDIIQNIYYDYSATAKALLDLWLEELKCDLMMLEEEKSCRASR